jgi:hypothetical protein
MIDVARHGRTGTSHMLMPRLASIGPDQGNEVLGASTWHGERPPVPFTEEMLTSSYSSPLPTRRRRWAVGYAGVGLRINAGDGARRQRDCGRGKVVRRWIVVSVPGRGQQQRRKQEDDRQHAEPPS